MSETNTVQLGRGVIIELDYAVLSGHQLQLEACQQQLQALGITLDAGLKARCMDGRSFSSGITNLAARLEKTIDAAAVVAATNAVYVDKLAQAAEKMPTGFVDFVRAVQQEGIEVVLISRADSAVIKGAFPEDVAEKLAFHTDTSSSFGFLGWESWRRIARKNDLRERLCVAVVGSGFSVKGALTSGFAVFGRENALTSYQDFSGCDYLLMDYSVALAGEVTRVLRV